MKFARYFCWCCFVLLTFSSVGCNGTERKKKKTEKSVPTTILQLKGVDMPFYYVADIQGIQFVEVRPKVEGFIEKIFVDEGEMIRKGDKLFELSSTVFSENVREAEAALKEAEAEYNLSIYEQSRINRLVEKNIISSLRLKQVNLELEVAQLKVEQAKARLERAHLEFNYTIITAPCNGYVDRIPYKAGSLVNTESLLTTISDVSQVFAYYKMNEADYLKYKRSVISGKNIQQRDSIELFLPDGSTYEYKGMVETVESDFESGTGSIAFRARFPNPDGLIRHGSSGKVCMTTHINDVYLIPQQSTFEIQEFTCVFIVDKENVVRMKSFNPLGRYKGFYITKDFAPKTQIVYTGLQGVRDGMKITPVVTDFEEIERFMLR